MRFAFWKKLPPPSTECTHLWSNWSDPATVSVTVTGFVNGGSSEYDREAQTRKCLHCNLHIRAWL